jgi:hypothetical protein
LPPSPYARACATCHHCRPGSRLLRTHIDNKQVFEVTDTNGRALAGDGIALITENGRINTGPVTVRPA